MTPKRTAAEQAELVAKLIENARDVIAVIDQDGTISFQSRSVERVLGYGPDELLGTSVFDLVHPEDLPGAWRRMEQVLTETGPTRLSLIRMRHMDGSWRTLEAVGRAMFDDPLVHGIVVNARDVTERLQLEDELREAQKLEAVGRLAGGIAHEFNNLLTVISGFSELLLRRLDADDVRRADAQAIRDAAVRGSQLTRRLLGFGRREISEPRTLELNDVVSGLMDTVAQLIGEDVELTLALDPHTGSVHADPGQLEQVVLDLVLNARDALPGGGRITVATCPSELEPGRTHLIAVPPGRYARLSISDTGTGMDGPTRGKVFEPFFTTKEGSNRSGLGLATVFRIVRESGGTIAVRSELAQGSTFDVYLPAAAAPEPTPAGGREAQRQGSETVLVVEDDEPIRAFAKRTLEASGYRVLLAADAEEGIALCRKRGGRIDLLLTDVVLPGANGRELAEQVQALWPAVRTLFMTGYTGDVLIRHGLQERSLDLIEKPFSPEELTGRVARVLDGQ